MRLQAHVLCRWSLHLLHTPPSMLRQLCAAPVLGCCLQSHALGCVLRARRRPERPGRPVQNCQRQAAAPCRLLQLPPGWSEGKDPSSGATYYYNTATGEGERGVAGRAGAAQHAKRMRAAGLSACCSSVRARQAQRFLCALSPAPCRCRPDTVGAARWHRCGACSSSPGASPFRGCCCHGQYRAAAAVLAGHVGECRQAAADRLGYCTTPWVLHTAALMASHASAWPTLHAAVAATAPAPAPRRLPIPPFDTPAGPACPPSAQFGGARPGYVFKSGPSGLGYYLDRPDTNRLLGEPRAGNCWLPSCCHSCLEGVMLPCPLLTGVLAVG